MFARTKRLTLRPGWPEDAKALTRAIAHESVAMKLGRLPWPYGEAEAKAFLAMPHNVGEPRFLILDHEQREPRIVGGIGLTAGEHAHELGYWLTPSAWGHGYATEAGRMVVEIARHALPIRRLIASHAIDNPASSNVLRKLGFRDGRPVRSFSLARGHEVDCLELSLALDADESRMPIAA